MSGPAALVGLTFSKRFLQKHMEYSLQRDFQAEVATDIPLAVRGRLN